MSLEESDTPAAAATAADSSASAAASDGHDNQEPSTQAPEGDGNAGLNKPLVSREESSGRGGGAEAGQQESAGEPLVGLASRSPTTTAHAVKNIWEDGGGDGDAVEILTGSEERNGGACSTSAIRAVYTATTAGVATDAGAARDPGGPAAKAEEAGANRGGDDDDGDDGDVVAGVVGGAGASGVGDCGVNEYGRRLSFPVNGLGGSSFSDGGDEATSDVGGEGGACASEEGAVGDGEVGDEEGSTARKKLADWVRAGWSGEDDSDADSAASG